jgi:hypothetical protein
MQLAAGGRVVLALEGGYNTKCDVCMDGCTDGMDGWMDGSYCTKSEVHVVAP